MQDGARSNGVLIAADAGARVVAAEAGQVVFVSHETGPLGAVMMVQHDGGMVTIYGRITDAQVSAGDTVAQGQMLARVSRPTSGDPRLQFELRLGSDPIDPTPYL